MANEYSARRPHTTLSLPLRNIILIAARTPITGRDPYIKRLMAVAVIETALQGVSEAYRDEIEVDSRTLHVMSNEIVTALGIEHVHPVQTDETVQAVMARFNTALNGAMPAFEREASGEAQASEPGSPSLPSIVNSETEEGKVPGESIVTSGTEEVQASELGSACAPGESIVTSEMGTGPQAAGLGVAEAASSESIVTKEAAKDTLRGVTSPSSADLTKDQPEGRLIGVTEQGHGAAPTDRAPEAKMYPTAPVIGASQASSSAGRVPFGPVDPDAPWLLNSPLQQPSERWQPPPKRARTPRSFESRITRGGPESGHSRGGFGSQANRGEHGSRGHRSRGNRGGGRYGSRGTRWSPRGG